MAEKKSESSALITKRVRRYSVLGVLFAALGVYLELKFPILIDNALKSQLQVKEGNDFTVAWNKNPFPLTLDIYVFGLLNPQNFANGAKAKLREYGPYTFDMWIYKDIISFNSDQTMVSFWESKSYHYRPNNSTSLSDQIQVINFPVYALSNMVRNMVSDLPLSFAITPVAMGFVNMLLMTHSESLVKEVTVNEWLNGYPFRILDTIDTLTRPLAWFGIKLPDTGMPDNKFGFLWNQNFTRGGPFEATTGQKGTELLKIVSYKNQNSLPYYNEPKCNALNGTDASTLGVNVQKNKVYYIFTADTCRSFNLVYQKNTWVNGIPTYRFIPNPLLFSGPSRNPDNRCYCRTLTNEPMCEGIFDLGPCLGGAPAAYSYPHFLGASDQLRNNVENMKPNITKHQAYIDVEPFMGAPIRGAEKLQMNALLKPIPYLGGFRNFRESVLPLLWMEKSAIIDDTFTTRLRMAIWPLYGIILIIHLMVFGGFAIIVGVAVHLHKKKNQTLRLNSMQNIPSRSNSKQALVEKQQGVGSFNHDNANMWKSSDFTSDRPPQRQQQPSATTSTFQQASHHRTIAPSNPLVARPSTTAFNSYSNKNAMPRKNVGKISSGMISSQRLNANSMQNPNYDASPIDIIPQQTKITTYSNMIFGTKGNGKASNNPNLSKNVEHQSNSDKNSHHNDNSNKQPPQKQSSLFSLDEPESDEETHANIENNFDLEKFDSTWSSVNEVILQQQHEERETKKAGVDENIGKSKNNYIKKDDDTRKRDRTTKDDIQNSWSPPGSVNE